MKRFLLPAMTAAFFIANNSVLAGDQCSCRYKGQDVPVGGQVCLKTPNGPRLATCGFELNNTSWKFSDRACDKLALDAPDPLEQALAFVRRNETTAPAKR